MAHWGKSRARRKWRKLARLKRISIMPLKAGRQEFAPPVRIIQPKKGKGGKYNRQKFKKGGDMGNKSNDFVASLIKAITI